MDGNARRIPYPVLRNDLLDNLDDSNSIHKQFDLNAYNIKLIIQTYTHNATRMDKMSEEETIKGFGTIRTNCRIQRTHLATRDGKAILPDSLKVYYINDWRKLHYSSEQVSQEVYVFGPSSTTKPIMAYEVKTTRKAGKGFQIENGVQLDIDDVNEFYEELAETVAQTPEKVELLPQQLFSYDKMMSERILSHYKTRMLEENAKMPIDQDRTPLIEEITKTVDYLNKTFDKVEENVLSDDLFARKRER